MAPKTAEDKLSAKTNHDLIVKLTQKVEALEKSNANLVKENKARIEETQHLMQSFLRLGDKVGDFSDVLKDVDSKVYQIEEKMEKEQSEVMKQAQPQGQPQ